MQKHNKGEFSAYVLTTTKKAQKMLSSEYKNEMKR